MGTRIGPHDRLNRVVSADKKSPEWYAVMGSIISFAFDLASDPVIPGSGGEARV